MKSIVIRAALVAAVVGVCAGCESLAYQGWSPSARTMTDDPGLGDVYWGANAEFHVLDKEQEGRPMRGSASSSARGEDFGWNRGTVNDVGAPATGEMTTAGIGRD
ncbi:MAG TPA: hypothetical protein VEA69_25365 [Tepidisphaeraceae bacterium]|nr:hypothetical protein [Tepidisphaeraceae bacterium]